MKKALPSEIYLGSYRFKGVPLKLNNTLCVPSVENLPACNVPCNEVASSIIQFSKEYQVQVPLFMNRTVTVINPQTTQEAWEKEFESYRDMNQNYLKPDSLIKGGSDSALSAVLKRDVTMAGGVGQFLGVLLQLDVPGFLRIEGTEKICRQGIILPVQISSTVESVLKDFKERRQQVADLGYVS